MRKVNALHYNLPNNKINEMYTWSPRRGHFFLNNLLEKCPARLIFDPFLSLQSPGLFIRRKSSDVKAIEE